MEYELITYFSTNLTMDEILDRWAHGTAAEQAIAKMIDDHVILAIETAKDGWWRYDQ